MSGDWIKIRPSLLTSPKVNGIARLLESSPAVARILTPAHNGVMSEVVTRNVMRNVTVASLVTIWGAVNEHARNGSLHHADLSDLDDMVGIPGFGKAMASVGWAIHDVDNACVIFPNFNEYNSCGAERTAKAMTNAERQRAYRERKKEGKPLQNDNVTGDVTHNVTGDVTSNHREEKSITTINQPANACAREDAFAMRLDWEPSTHLPDMARQAGAAITPEIRQEFIAHWLTQSQVRRTQAEWDKSLLQSALHHKARNASNEKRNAEKRKAPPAENFDAKQYGEGIHRL